MFTYCLGINLKVLTFQMQNATPERQTGFVRPEQPCLCCPSCFKCGLTYVILIKWFTVVLTRLQAGGGGGSVFYSTKGFSTLLRLTLGPSSVLSTGTVPKLGSNRPGLETDAVLTSSAGNKMRSFTYISSTCLHVMLRVNEAQRLPVAS
jgi:hypothetical protein